MQKTFYVFMVPGPRSYTKTIKAHNATEALAAAQRLWGTRNVAYVKEKEG